jgi:hypothetical protein
MEHGLPEISRLGTWPPAGNNGGGKAPELATSRDCCRRIIESTKKTLRGRRDRRGQISRRTSRYRTSHNRVTISQNIVTFLQFSFTLWVCLYLRAGIFKVWSVVANKQPVCLLPAS